MILTAGENVYSVEVERVLNDHEDVRYAAVFGVPNAMLGELVKAVVVFRDEAPRDACKRDACGLVVAVVLRAEASS